MDEVRNALIHKGIQGFDPKLQQMVNARVRTEKLATMSRGALVALGAVALLYLLNEE